MVSNLAMVVALASAQPACQPDDTACLEAAEAVAQSTSEEQQIDEEEEVDLSGPILVTGQIVRPEGDPAEELNAATYEVVQAIDIALVEPIADAYDDGIPKPLRNGLRNVLRNLGEPISFLNFLLQLKPGKALKSLGRFAINTTIGIGGLFDPASKQPFNLEREYNGLANTLGYYGVGPGPYLYLPFIGSTTVRDLFGRIVDLSIIPNLAGKPFNQPIYAIPVGTLTALESRIETDDQIQAIRDRCGDPYSASRDIYLIQRQIEIDDLRGKPSENLPELVERLEINCDIKLLTSGEIAEGLEPDGKPGLIDPDALEEAEPDAAGAVGEPPVQSAPLEEEPEIVAEPEVVEASEPAAPVFVSRPVVQPLSAEPAS